MDREVSRDFVVRVDKSNAIFLVIFSLIFSVFFVPGVMAVKIWTDLSATDPGNWVGSSDVNRVVYDPNNSLVYTGINSGKFGVYNKTDNVWTDLSATDPGNWAATFNVLSLKYDSDNDLVYTGNSGGDLGAYNRTENSWNLLADVGIPINTIDYDPFNGLIYLGLQASFGNFFIYNLSDDTLYEFHDSSINTGGIFDLVLVGNNLVYAGHQGGMFDVFNKTDDSWYRLNATDTGGWAIRDVFRLAYDSNNDLVYTGHLLGQFGVYNKTSNVWTDLSATDPGNWVKGTDPEIESVTGLAYDSNNDLVYTGISSGEFGAYNRTSNVWVNLNTTDPGNWIGSSQINGLAYSQNNNLLYGGMGGGKFGVYQELGGGKISILGSLTSKIRIGSGGILRFTYG